MLVVSMRTSVPSWKLCAAAMYPILYNGNSYFRNKFITNQMTGCLLCSNVKVYSDTLKLQNTCNSIENSMIYYDHSLKFERYFGKYFMKQIHATYLKSKLGRTHDFNNVECCPADIISQHLKLKYTQILCVTTSTLDINDTCSKFSIKFIAFVVNLLQITYVAVILIFHL